MCSRNRVCRTGMSIVLVAGLFASLAEARVVRFVVEQRRVFADGMTFGTVGPYERLDGTVYMEVDPADPLNALIVNLDKAPRNARNMVEFSRPFIIMHQMAVSCGNDDIFYGVYMRGNTLQSGYRAVYH